MRYFPLSNISIFQIEVFLAAAKELNFTRAAKICSTTQPTVSRQISALEETLGIVLFVKRGGNLQLTPAGKSLRNSLDDTLRRLRENIETAHTLQQGYKTTLNITVPALDPIIYFIQMKSAFSRSLESRDIQVNYQVNNGDIAVTQLLSFETDIVFFVSPYKDQFEQYSELETRYIMKTHLSALMLKNNPLSSRQSVSIEDLKSQKLILPKDAAAKMYVENVLRYFQRANIIPGVASYANSFAECLLKLDDTDEIVIVDKASWNFDYSLLSCVDIEGTESGFFIAWRKSDSDAEHVRQFVDFATKFFGLHQSLHTK